MRWFFKSIDIDQYPKITKITKFEKDPFKKENCHDNAATLVDLDRFKVLFLASFILFHTTT